MEKECIECKAWDRVAKENGYYSGMCKECFDKNFVLFENLDKPIISQNHRIFDKEE